MSSAAKTLNIISCCFYFLPLEQEWMKQLWWIRLYYSCLVLLTILNLRWVLFPCRTYIAISPANLQLEYCILFVTSPHGFNLMCCSALLAPPPPAQSLVLHAASRQCFKSLLYGFGCLTLPSKAESDRTLSVLLKLIKAFSLTLMGVQSSFGMLLHILNSCWFLAGPSGTKPLQCRPKVCS